MGAAPGLWWRGGPLWESERMQIDYVEFGPAAGEALTAIAALVFEGPGLVTRIKRELAAMLRADGFASIHEAIGAA